MWFRRRPAGYTLLELLTVLALIGVLASLAAPSLRGWTDRLRLRALLDRFTADLFHARALAARSGRELQLRFESDGTSCIARYSLIDPGSRRTLKVVDLSREHPRICLTVSGSPRIRIDPRGMPRGAARKLRARIGERRDSLSISLVGRVYRWERALGRGGRTFRAKFIRYGNHCRVADGPRNAKSLFCLRFPSGTYFS
jgi:type II secretion system protein H